MGKKNEQLDQKKEEKKRLTPEQFWKWKCRLTESWNEDNKLNLLKKEVEAFVVKKNLEIKNQEARAVKAAKDYAEVSSEIEKSLGIKLEGYAVDDETLEITKL